MAQNVVRDEYVGKRSKDLLESKDRNKERALGLEQFSVLSFTGLSVASKSRSE